MAPKSLASVGFVVLMLAILLLWGTNHWLRTRTFEPVNIPVWLESGKSQSVKFEINLHETYWVSFHVDDSANDWTPGMCSSNSLTRAHWKAYRLSNAGENRELWADSEEYQFQGMFLTRIRGIPGRYELEWGVPDESACLNPRHPRLTISSESYYYKEIFGLTAGGCLLVGGAGAMLVLRGLFSWILGFFRRPRSLRMFPDLVLRNVLPLRRHRSAPLICDLPHFPLCLSGVVLILIFIFMILEQPLMSHGFLVHLDRSTPKAWGTSPWPETMSVYVDGPYGFYVNGRHVESKYLAERLNEELGKRMSWTVYFEADESVRFSDAEYAMSTIQHLGAKLIWITPNIRAGMNQTAPK